MATDFPIDRIKRRTRNRALAAGLAIGLVLGAIGAIGGLGAWALHDRIEPVQVTVPRGG